MLGLQGCGKTTWVREHLAGTHTVVSKDLWPRARRREARRQRVIAELLAAGVPVRAVWLDTPPELCAERNDAREGRARVPLVCVLATRSRWEAPTTEEGFDRVEVVRPR